MEKKTNISDSEILKKIASYSKTEQHETIVNMLYYYNKQGTRDLTTAQMQDYLKFLEKKQKEKDDVFEY